MKYLFLLILSIPVSIVARILTPILPLFAIGKDHLPSWLSWLDTPDAPIFGDTGFQQTHDDSYLTRVIWLWRNSAYGFSCSVLGATINEKPTVEYGDIWVGNQAAKSIGRTTGKSGVVKITSGDYWEWYYVKQWGSTGRCLRIRIGWKLSGFVQDPADYPMGTKAQFVFSFNPLMGFAI